LKPPTKKRNKQKVQGSGTADEDSDEDWNRVWLSIRQDFDYMKIKLQQLTEQVQEGKQIQEQQDEEIRYLKTENIKLQSDIKIIRNDHSELLH
jgi:hypothetical protein